MVERRSARGADGEAALRDAATSLLRQHGRQILRYLSALLHDREAAADVFGAFEEDLWRGLPSFRGECSRKSWAYRLALHAAIRYLRDPWRRRAVPLGPGAGLDAADDLAPGAAQPTSSDRAEQRTRAVAALREQLRPAERTLLALRVDQRLSWEQVAAVLSRPGEPPAQPSALRKRFERLIAKLGRQAQAIGLLGSTVPARTRG
ncbi:RNA polymerase sigma factor [Anaeromyxobacter paludicola]|uniref:RNA polymerase sigma-70 region 2 domain-containing protein n=1 Tax=Anaeromyxobacter paludicola TaxID=2918171 RepID=A0ABM7XF41_9BACT|nr:sigma-70 family RNA polymerase sigma factor [Anaeromyxobacter paludicola]BDG10473.1 hypothetical protein AMPC_35860 [Anaeromyxobacter paludicola]